eukprot:4221372-Pleurochrysis_carterae.AAC.1
MGDSVQERQPVSALAVDASLVGKRLKSCADCSGVGAECCSRSMVAICSRALSMIDGENSTGAVGWKQRVRRGCNRSRRVGLALYGRSNLKSIGSPEAVPLRSAPPTSDI